MRRHRPRALVCYRTPPLELSDDHDRLMKVAGVSKGWKSKASSNNSKRLAGLCGHRAATDQPHCIGKLIRKCTAGSPNERCERLPNGQSGTWNTARNVQRGQCL